MPEARLTNIERTEVLETCKLRAGCADRVSERLQGADRLFVSPPHRRTTLIYVRAVRKPLGKTDCTLLEDITTRLAAIQ